MATWIDSNGDTWGFDDNKLNFNDWLAESKLTDEWEEACKEHYEWTTENADKHPTEHDGKAGVIFKQWAVYANAIAPDYSLKTK